MTAQGITKGAASVALACIATSADFRFRQGPLDLHHREALATSLRASGKPFDPLLLWKRPGATEGERLVLLDGEHRLAAYRLVKWPGEVPALILECDRRTALAKALAANARPVLPLSEMERMNAAWRLVRENVAPRFKVKEVVQLACSATIWMGTARQSGW
jgi:ParB-like nuclease domain